MSARTVSVAVIGAGAVGLFTAYALLNRGAEVTVYEREGLSTLRNASWGNAGHIVPVMSLPIASPGNIKAAAHGLMDRRSFMRVPTRIDRHTAGFMRSFLRSSRRQIWRSNVAALQELNTAAISEFEAVAADGIDCGFERAPFVSAFESAKAARAQLADHVDVAHAGSGVAMRLLGRAELHQREPLAGAVGQFGLALEHQALLRPPTMMASLVATLRERGARFVQGEVTEVGSKHSGDVVVHVRGQRPRVHHKVVVSTGAWLDELTSAHGVRTRVLAGFGYSALLESAHLPEGMLYFPEAKIASTRLGSRLRVSSLLQIDRPGAAFDARSARLLEANVRRVLPTVDWRTAREMWHGGRPIASDGIPILGESRTPNIYVNGGHGMWGVTLGPISGRLLAEALLDGRSEIAAPGFSARRAA